jgi:hypothetical protein
MENEVGTCDECGAPYDTGSQIDHDAERGVCWNCSPEEGP